MKKSLNQAKIQIIHKLTRKAKTLTEKKAPEQIQGKLKKKAESAVKEVLIIKVCYEITLKRTWFTKITTCSSKKFYTSIVNTKLFFHIYFNYI